jgi:hypothetical protein
MTIASIIAESARHTLVQLPELHGHSDEDVAAIAQAIGRNAAAVLQADPVALLIAATRAFGPGTLRAECSPYESGNVAVRVQVTTADEVAQLGALLDCRTPELTGHGKRAWHEAARGQPGDPLQVTITGGYHEVPTAAATRKAG